MKRKIRNLKDLMCCWLATWLVERVYANTTRKADALRDLKRLDELTRMAIPKKDKAPCPAG